MKTKAKKQMKQTLSLLTALLLAPLATPQAAEKLATLAEPRVVQEVAVLPAPTK